MENNQKVFSRIFQILIAIPIFYLLIIEFINLSDLLSPDYQISTKILNILFITTLVNLIYFLNQIRKENKIGKYKWVIIASVIMLFAINRMIFFSPPIFFHLPLAAGLFLLATKGHMFGINPAIEENKATKKTNILLLSISIILFIIGSMLYILSISGVF